MPLVNDENGRAKCAFKMLQYMGCETPSVVTPSGSTGTFSTTGEVVSARDTTDEWVDAFEHLYADREAPEARREAGASPSPTSTDRSWPSTRRPVPRGRRRPGERRRSDEHLLGPRCRDRSSLERASGLGASIHRAAGDRHGRPVSAMAAAENGHVLGLGAQEASATTRTTVHCNR